MTATGTATGETAPVPDCRTCAESGVRCGECSAMVRALRDADEPDPVWTVGHLRRFVLDVCFEDEREDFLKWVAERWDDGSLEDVQYDVCQGWRWLRLQWLDSLKPMKS